MEDRQTTQIPVHSPSLGELFFFFLSGIISSVPFTLTVDQFAASYLIVLPDSVAILVSAVVIAPFLEEFAKAFPLLYRHGETQRSIFILGLLVGLGFGVFEFFGYVFLLGVPFYLRLPAVFFHAASASIIAYGIATKRAVEFYFIAVVLHFVINLSAFFPFLGDLTQIGPWSFGTFLATAATYILSWQLYLRTTTKVIN